MVNIVDNSLLPRIRTYLNSRGISDETIECHKISWDGTRIVIPIFDVTGMWLFNKYRRDPELALGPKYTYDSGSTMALYCHDLILRAPRIVICEGEFDALLLQQMGFPAVTSTGGAGSFREEWVKDFINKDIYIVFDNDAAGLRGATRITQ